MRNYELTFIVDPVLSGEEIKTTAQTYIDLLKGAGASIVHIDEMGLRTLAYPINKRNSGVYYCVEFQSELGEFIDEVELALRRDERIMRFLTYRLDKFGVKYNEDKRNGLIAKAKRPKSKEKKEREASEQQQQQRGGDRDRPHHDRPQHDRPAAPAAVEPTADSAAVNQED